MPEHQWPRLLVYTELAPGTPAQEQVQALLDKGYDLELSPDQRYAEIIAIAEDLKTCDGWAIRPSWCATC